MIPPGAAQTVASNYVLSERQREIQKLHKTITGVTSR